MANSDDVKNLKALYEEIDLFLGGLVSGERVELIVTPSENKKERIITLGIQNGFSRDKSSFIITDGDNFDNNILPNIMNYYEEFDKYKDDWQVSIASLPNQTDKAVLETESGNLLYIETFDKNLFDRLKNRKQVPAKAPLSQEELEWQAIIEYVKSRRVINDALKNNLQDEERDKLELLLSFISNNRKFVVGTNKAIRSKVKDNLKMLLSAESFNSDLEKIGINVGMHTLISSNLDKNLRDKLINNESLDYLATFMQAEQKINKFLEKNKENLTTSVSEFKDKIVFALMELSKTNYYEKRNISYDALLKTSTSKNYGDNCAGEIQKLKNAYEEGKINLSSDENTKKKYIKYCDEILGYLTTKSKQTFDKKQNIENIRIPVNEDINISLHNSVIMHDDFNGLIEKINLCKGAKINDEKFEIIIADDPSNKNNRLVKIALLNGMSRSDSFEFEFTDGNKFDLDILPKVMSIVTNDDKIATTKMSDDTDRKVLMTTDDGNEILITKTILDKLQEEADKNKVEYDSKEQVAVTPKIDDTLLSGEYQELKEYFALVVEKRKKESLQASGQLSNIGIQSLDKISQRMQELSKKNKKLEKLDRALNELETGKLSQEEYQEIYDSYLKEITEYETASIGKEDELSILKREIKNSIAIKESQQELFPHYDDKFENLHQLVRKYDIQSNNGKIIDRNTNNEYVPSSQEELERIKFATYWNNNAGIEESKDDIVPKEKSAFSDKARNLFNIMDVHVEESIKKGVTIDFESLKRQFKNTMYDKASIIYERLFKTKEHVKYIIDYYLGQLNMRGVKNSGDFLLEPQFNKAIPTKSSDNDAYYYSDSKTLDEIDASIKTDYNAPSETNKQMDIDEQPSSSFNSAQQENENALKEISDAYSMADGYSTYDKPASLKIFFPNDSEDIGEVIVSYGPTNDEDVLYSKSFKKDVLINVMLQNICDIYVSNSGISSNEIYETPNKNKAGSITLGKNDNLLQISNASKEEVNLMQSCLRNSESKLKKAKKSNIENIHNKA